MKKLIRLSVVALAVGLLQVAQASPYTNYLDELSNVVAFANATLPSDTPAKVRSLLGKAAKDFQKPSTSVAGDYKIFLAVATHLMPLESLVDPGSSGALGGASSNAFTNFVIYAVTKIDELSARIESVTPFQGVRRAASNQVAGAIRSMTIVATTSNINVGILALGAALNKLAMAEKLTARAEANQGFALDSIAGMDLTHTTTHEQGTIYLGEIGEDAHGPYHSYPLDDPEGDYGVYSYTRTGLSTATLVLQNQKSEDGSTTTVKLRFTSKAENGSAEGTFSGKNSNDGPVKGAFTVTHPL
jgi:hypothetical protein